jgi:phospholipase C
MLIITYDEHGGFFDHVTPPKMSTEAGGATFQTTGVRVPAFIISPYVTPGSVLSEQMDSTSILQLLADKYTPGKDYSPAVAARKALLKPLAKYFERLTRNATRQADSAGLAESACERRADGNSAKRASFCDLASVSAGLVRDV